MPDEDEPWWATVVMPVLFAAARESYGRAIKVALAEVGCGDMPRSGSRLIGGIARSGQPMRDLVDEMGVSKQRTGQLIDVLVDRGYLTRETDPEDRRRLMVDLTERGTMAAEAIRRAVDRLDSTLEAAVGAEDVATLRRVAGTLVALNDPHFD